MRRSPLVPATALDRQAGIMLDVRPAPAHAFRRVAGSVRVPVEAWKAALRRPEERPENREFWLRQFRDLGLDGRAEVLIHDDGRMTHAAEVWLLLTLHGFEARVVDGGWPHLRDGPGPFESGAPWPPDPVGEAVPPGSTAVGIVDREGVRDALFGPARILDVRSIEEHVGLDLRENRRGGHLPGAVHLPHDALRGADGRMLPPGAIRARALASGLGLNESVVVHCDGDGRGALAALALFHAGWRDVWLYHAGFADWAADRSCPVISGRAEIRPPRGFDRRRA